MIKINEKIGILLRELDYYYKKIGHFSEYGAIMDDDCEFVLYYKDGGYEPYLAHISEFERNDTGIKLKTIK